MADKDFVVKNGLVVNTTITVGSSTVNTSAIVIGNNTVNASLSSNGVFLNGVSSGSYYRGNYGAVGSINSKANLFRINSNTQSANIEFLAGENAQTTGPLTVNTGYYLIIDSGARVSIV